MKRSVLCLLWFFAVAFSVPTEDRATVLNGQIDLPNGARCEAGEAKFPLVLMVPGTGRFDRDVAYGNSGTEKDLLFKDLAATLTRAGLAVARFDLRRNGTPESIRSDIQRVFEYAAQSPCVDSDRIVVFAHSEGSFHVARLVHDQKIAPKALAFMGMVAESPKSLVHWQSVDRKLGEALNTAPETEREKILARLEQEYETARAKALALHDDGVHEGFWSNRWWKMWWNDDRRVVDDLLDFPGAIVAHHGARDTRVSATRQFALLRSAFPRFKIPPKLVLHPGVGHSLGPDALVGPMSESPKRKLAADIARLAGLDPGADPQEVPELTEEEIAKTPYLGLNFVISAPLPKDERYRSGFGLYVTTVGPTFPAWKAGIRPGDILIAMNGDEIGSAPKEQALGRFIKNVRGLAAGTTAALRVMRFQEGKFLPHWIRPYDLLEKTVTAAAPTPPAAFALPPDIDKAPGKSLEESVEKAAEDLAHRYAFEAEYQDLKKRIAEMTSRPDPFRLPVVDAVQHRPFAWGKTAQAVAERLDSSFLSEAARLIDPRADIPVSSRADTGDALNAIRASLEEANVFQREAFRDLTAEEVRFLRENFDPLFRKFEEHNYIYQDDEPKRRDRNYEVIALASRVHLAPLARAAAALLRISDPMILGRLEEELRTSGRDLSAARVFEEKTAFGSIVIAGTGDDWHHNNDHIAVLIDLGGNDVYANRAGTAGASVPASIVVDLAGNDAYETNVDYALAAGFLGVGVVVDRKGSDAYVGVRGTQGSAFLGVGLLIDEEGDDVYRAHTYAQGSAFRGIAALIDRAGHDRYEAHQYAQGVGIAGGVGGLIDSSGDDRYFAGGFFPSGYRTPGTFQGWSQGVGIGLRFLGSGGVGLLRDGGGRDTMEGGDFSQGGGYYFGMGLLDAQGLEDDTYKGSRYAQGFSAHSALGAFFERGGNDAYDSVSGVSQGIANDLSMTWFEDVSGRDRYVSKYFTLGTSANNGIAVFFDRDGIAELAGKLEPANSQSNDYHGGISLSLLSGLRWPASDDGLGEYRFSISPH